VNASSTRSISTSTGSIASFPGTLETGRAEPPHLRLHEGDASDRDQARSDRGILCRFLNFVVALLGIVVTAPLMLLIAVAIKLTSPGPVFYTQPRVGLDRREGERRIGERAGAGRRSSDQGGRVFRIYKFRTMRPPREDDPQVWCEQDDPRITRIGKILRAYRLDELPQFFNVLLGDMNIVGPRPEQPMIFEELRGEIFNYERRQRVRPGITGLAQISLGYDQTLDDVRKKVDLDLQYIGRRSPIEDLRIMAQTPQVMVGRRGSM